MFGFKALTRELLYTVSRRNSLGICLVRRTGFPFLVRPVVFGLSIFRFHARSDFSGGFRRSRMLADELEAMTRARLGHFYLSTASLARHSLHMRMCHVVEHNCGHNRRVLPAMLA